MAELKVDELIGKVISVKVPDDEVNDIGNSHLHFVTVQHSNPEKFYLYMVANNTTKKEEKAEFELKTENVSWKENVVNNFGKSIMLINRVKDSRESLTEMMNDGGVVAGTVNKDALEELKYVATLKQMEEDNEELRRRLHSNKIDMDLLKSVKAYTDLNKK